jgi:hypothetical protein
MPRPEGEAVACAPKRTAFKDNELLKIKSMLTASSAPVMMSAPNFSNVADYIPA